MSGPIACPFCGEQESVKVDATAIAGWYSVECYEDIGGCGAEVHGRGWDGAIAAWNRRAPTGRPNRLHICLAALAFVAFSALTVWSCNQPPAMHSGMEYRP